MGVFHKSFINFLTSTKQRFDLYRIKQVLIIILVLIVVAHVL